MLIGPASNWSYPGQTVETTANLTTYFNPGERSSAAREMLPRIELMRACYGGTETMRQMGQTFLRQYPRETKERYFERLNSTFAVNKLQEAVDAASAKPFKNLLELKKSDAFLDEWIWDADLCGNHLHLVAHEFFNEAVLTGLCHILVDHPSSGIFENLAQQKAAKARPFFRLIRAEDLLACYEERINGEKQIVHARIRGSRIGFDRNTFREVIFDQVFVMEPGIVQLWERPRSQMLGSDVQAYLGPGGTVVSSNPLPQRFLPYEGNGGWRLAGEQKTDLKKIPLVTMHAGKDEGNHKVRPIFLDLAYKQIEHWISSSDQRNILSASRFAMLAASGITVDETDEGTNSEGEPQGQGFEIGPWKILTSPDPQGKWYYVEPEGKSIELGQRDLENLESQMDQLSLNPIVSQPGKQYVAQNERSITETRVNTVVHDLAFRARDALERAIGLVGEWMGKDYTKVSLEMNFDFSSTDDRSRSIANVLQAAVANTLSRESALHEFKRLGLLSDTFDVEAELSRPVVNPIEGTDVTATKKAEPKPEKPAARPGQTA